MSELQVDGHVCCLFVSSWKASVLFVGFELGGICVPFGIPSWKLQLGLQLGSMCVRVRFFGSCSCHLFGFQDGTYLSHVLGRKLEGICVICWAPSWEALVFFVGVQVERHLCYVLGFNLEGICAICGLRV